MTVTRSPRTHHLPPLHRQSIHSLWTIFFFLFLPLIPLWRRRAAAMSCSSSSSVRPIWPKQPEVPLPACPKCSRKELLSRKTSRADTTNKGREYLKCLSLPHDVKIFLSHPFVLISSVFSISCSDLGFRVQVDFYRGWNHAAIFRDRKSVV